MQPYPVETGFESELYGTATRYPRWRVSVLYTPAWVVQPVSEDFRWLVGAVEVRVVPGYGVRGRTDIRVHVHPQN